MAVLADQRPTRGAAKSVVTGAVRPKRRWSLLVGGLLLVLVCAGIFAVVQLSGDARVQVLAVARPVAAGQAISAEDLRVVGVVPDASVPLVRASRLTEIVGQTAAVPLAEGTLLAESQLGPASWPQAGQAVVAVALKPGRVPAGCAAGSHVRIVTVAKETTTETSAPPAAVSVAAVVVGVTEAVDGAGTSVVSLLLTQDDATKIAGAGSELALVLVNN